MGEDNKPKEVPETVFYQASETVFHQVSEIEREVRTIKELALSVTTGLLGAMQPWPVQGEEDREQQGVLTRLITIKNDLIEIKKSLSRVDETLWPIEGFSRR